MECLRVQNLSKNFGGLKATGDVSFSVETGKRLVIIGPNGAGKTTLFNLLSGALAPDEGQIQFLGHNITNLAPEKRAALGLARTFQVTQLFRNLTLLDNILLGIQALESAKYSMIRPLKAYKDNLAKAQKLLEQWELWSQKDALIRNLSYGDQRKVEIILALTGKPKLLLLDEPTAGLAPAETENLTSVILSLGRDITVLLIEHDMDVAFKVAEHIMVLHFGQFVAEGSPEEIRKNPKVNEVYLGAGPDANP
jgi:branched-chain amino acid transport system ATP-binding protein